MERKNAWDTYNKADLKKLEEVNKAYRNYLDVGKTERECVSEVIRMAKTEGYKDLDTVIAKNQMLKKGDKIYRDYMGRAIVLFQIGEEPLDQGLNILGAHVDSPRIDIKQVPLFEEQGYAYLDTHYYGGIKKFQWLVLPLALHGIVVKKDGTKVDIVIGEKEDDPVFVITDILPHLGKEQRKKTAEEFINGEKMDLLIGNRPLKGTEKDPVKATILEFLKKNYKLEEQDFLSAELEIVPAGKARDCGLDRSMIIGYGQDDRVCAFTSVLAMLETKDTKRTTCCILVDKEEIGSVGASGMTSKFFENAIAELVDRTGEYSELQVRRTLANSRMLSSDVSAAYDPMYAECYEKRNSAYLGEGLVFNKYTGSGGKSGSNDANPEYMAKMRNIMDSNHITWQTAELGAVDIGGGGTIAYLMAEYMMDVIDSGIAVLNMHAPWEVTSKADIYEGVKGYGVFLKEA
ncbi:MAG: aminopeptidase [Lachnospiraceae bacterium]